MSEKKVVLSGVRATGKVHLGNYIGAIANFAEMSQSGEFHCLFFVADFHSLTTLKESEKIRQYLPNVVLDYLAAGINLDNAAIYAQSQVPSVTELMWYLNCLTQVPDILNQPQYKDKASRNPDTNNVGLLTYPILMAADILGPRANLVPVGKDQEAHVEFARDLAARFNNAYGNFFPLPKSLSSESVMIPGLEPPNEAGVFPKMGKSDGNTINLRDSEDEIWEKIRVTQTDPARFVKSNPGNPDKCVIYALHSALSSGEDIRWVREGCQTAGIGCIECKRKLSANINDALAEFRERRKQFEGKPNLVADVLAHGKSVATKLFDETVQHMRDTFGVGNYTSF